MLPEDVIRLADKQLNEFQAKHLHLKRAKAMEITVIISDKESASVRYSPANETSGKRKPLSIGYTIKTQSIEIHAVVDV